MRPLLENLLTPPEDEKVSQPVQVSLNRTITVRYLEMLEKFQIIRRWEVEGEEWVELTPAGRDVWKDWNEVIGMKEESLVEEGWFLQANYEIILDWNSTSPWSSNFLYQICRPVSNDKISTLRLSKESLWEGIEAGLEQDTILKFLSRGGRKPTPQNVLFSVNEWCHGYGKLRLERTTILRSEDEAILDKLELSPHYSYRVQRIGPGIAAVTGDPKRLIEDLKKDHYLPANYRFHF